MAEKETPVPAAKQSERKELQTLNKRNYQKELDKLIENIQKEGKTPRLFLHACCAPCSSYVMEYLSQYFEITIFLHRRRNMHTAWLRFGVLSGRWSLSIR